MQWGLLRGGLLLLASLLGGGGGSLTCLFIVARTVVLFLKTSVKQPMTWTTKYFIFLFFLYELDKGSIVGISSLGELSPRENS